MSNKLPLSFREVFNYLHKFDFIITGSISLYLQGILNRVPGDIDLITDDYEMVRYLRSTCVEYTQILNIPGHFRFLYQDSIYVDVFIEDIDTKTTVEGKIGAKIYKLSTIKDVYLTKILKKLNTDKTLNDVKSYFLSLN